MAWSILWQRFPSNVTHWALKFSLAEVIYDNSITNQASKLTHPCLRGEGADGRGEILSQIHFLLIGVWTLSGPLLMDPDDLLDTLTSSVHCWEDGLASNPPASLLGWVGIGGRPPGPTLWSFMHHANLLSSCCRCCCCLLFYPCYWVERRCFNPGLMAGVSRWALICNTHPFGVGGSEALPDWHPESASRLLLCM